MPIQEVLILAVTRMLAGVCVAGMTQAPDRTTGLRWVRPVREHGHVLIGDITTPDGGVLCPFDVVAFNLIRSRPEPPHVEDCVADFVRQQPCVVRRLEGERRAGFLHKYLDRAPEEVLQRHQRSLCLIKPDWVKGLFHLDGYSGNFEARLSFGLSNWRYLGSVPKGGLAVTDLKWRAAGRAWVPAEGGGVEWDNGDLEVRFGVREIYLALGLSRSHEGAYWPIVIGVHTLPDYQATVDYDNL